MIRGSVLYDYGKEAEIVPPASLKQTIRRVSGHHNCCSYVCALRCGVNGHSLLIVFASKSSEAREILSIWEFLSGSWKRCVFSLTPHCVKERNVYLMQKHITA